MSGDDHPWHYDYARLAFDTGFNFETYRSKSLDKLIGPINVDHIIKDRDVATIEKHIPAVIEFSLDNDQTSVLDPTFVKVFQLSQLSVQYLLFCKKYLDNSVVLIKQEYQKSNEENKNLKRQVDELSHETSNYKKQIKELKASINTQIAVNQNTGIFQCQECPKAFSTEEFLLAHIKRRHESFGIVVAHSNTAFQAETDKLQLEIKQLKERLNNTERFVSQNELMTVKEYSSKPPNTEQNVFVSELQEKFEHLKTHVDSELRILQTQKFEKEKYEKWFETFLTNKLNVVSNLNDKPNTVAATTTTGTQGEILANNCSTQTESLVLPTPVCETCQNKEFQMQPPGVEFQNYQENKIKNQVFHAEELQERFHLETQNRLQKFEELLEERVTGSIEKLENQMQTFLVKINDIEEQRSKLKLTTSIDSFQEEVVPRAPKPRKQTVGNKNTTSQLLTSKSTDQINNIGLPKSSINKKPVVANCSTNSVMIKKFYSSSSESEEESDSTESEVNDDNHEVVINKPVVKISATSTLGRRSLTSLKEAAFTPKVLSQLQKEVEKVMQNRLVEIGVDPKSNGISVRHYQRALGLVSHQASVIQKNVSNYMQIRKHIMKDVESKATERSKAASSQNSKLKTLLSSFRRNTGTSKSPQKVVSKLPIPQSRNMTSDNMKIEVDFFEGKANSPLNNKSNKLSLHNPVSTNLKRQTHPDSTDSESIVSFKGSGAPTRKPLLDQTDLINDTEAQTKGVLKNYPTVGSLAKKKVLFDLDSADSKENIKPVIQSKTIDGGSTTSIASSALDGSKGSLVETLPAEKKKQDAYDSSDWELSEVSTN